MRIFRNTGYPMDFNLPDPLKSISFQRRYLPFGEVWRPAEGIGFMGPVGADDVAHFWNGIPLRAWEPKRWVVSFEAHFPRCLNGGDRLRRVLRERLLSPRCHGIFAISEWATRIFADYNIGWEPLPSVVDRMRVLPPTIAPDPRVQDRHPNDGPLKAVFVGRNFARKGGIAILRAAKEQNRLRSPVHFTLISSLQLAEGAHAEAKDRSLYDDDLRLLDLPNVTWIKEASNEKVREVMLDSDLLLLPTLYDTYGYSVLEGYSCGIPAITTNICALPEILVAGDTGCMITLPVAENNVWAGIKQVEQTGDWGLLTSTYDDIARQLTDTIGELVEDRQRVAEMGEAAVQRLRSGAHNPTTAAHTLLLAYGASRRDLPATLASLLDH